MTDDLVKRLRICAPFDPDQAEAADRIEQLEAALQLIIEHPVDNSHQWQVACNEMRKVARKAMGVENE